MQLYATHEELGRIVSDISDKQKVLKDNMDKVKNPKVKRQMQEYYDKLETQRAELIPTKQTSIFADETRLREDITQVYSSVANTEAAPNNLQIERANALQAKVSEAGKRKDALAAQYEEKIKAALVKEGLLKTGKTEGGNK
jgi:hypothetical protein